MLVSGFMSHYVLKLLYICSEEKERRSRHKTALRAERSGVQNQNIHNGSGPTQPPYHLVISGVKWPGREIDHSPPSIAKVKNEWRYIQYLFPLHAFVNWTGKSLLYTHIFYGECFW